MEIYENHINKTDDLYDYKRYIGFWPYLLISCFILLTSSYLYLRYANYIYESKSKIEIIDKSQDDDMALPTAMTIFNRSMINLENEIGLNVLGSIPRTKDLANFNPNKLSTFFEPLYNELLKVT